MRQTERRIDGIIQFARPSDACAQQSPPVEHDPHCLAALHLIYFRDQVPAARRSRPANFAILIARAGTHANFQIRALGRVDAAVCAPSALAGCESSRAPRAALAANSDTRELFAQAQPVLQRSAIRNTL